METAVDWTMLFKMFETGGPVAIIAGIMIWHNIKQATKIVSIVESNTKAMTEMKDMIKSLLDKMHC